MSKELSNPEVERYVPRLAVGLVHYPIKDRAGNVVATNVTNFDIHDIARAAKVFGVDKYFIIHPMKEQLMFVDRIIDHWRVGPGSTFNPMRRTALTDVFTAESVEEARKLWAHKDPLVIATHARPVEGVKSYTFKELRVEMYENKRPVFLLWGTGFGLTTEFMQGCDGVLESIRGAPPLDYRHLSVRSAASICLDRLMGPW
jgi:hypothetical protein